MKSTLVAICLSCLLALRPSFAELPAQILDLSGWKLTLPVGAGEPDEIEPPKLLSFVDNKHFFVSKKAGGVVFRAYCDGVTTKGSRYPRCELREMKEKPGGGMIDAAWSTDDRATHSMMATLAITKTPDVKKHVVCAQIHDASDDVMMLRLEGTKLFVERNEFERIMLNRRYEFGTPVKLKLQAGSGRIKLWYNDTQMMDWQHSRQGCYFKVGCYTQSNRDKGDTPESYGEVVVSRLRIEHSQ